MALILNLQSLLTSIKNPELLMNEPQSYGFILAMAATPAPLPPDEWLNFLWGNMDPPPFDSPSEFETYVECVVDLWNTIKSELLSNAWQWPEGYEFDGENIVTEQVKSCCEGILQGWQLTNDDWQERLPADTQEGAFLGGVLLSVSMLYDPDTAAETLREHGAIELEQFEEIYQALPAMLCRLAQLGDALATHC